MVLSDELVMELRTTLIAMGRGKKGELSRAVEEAIRLWLSQQKKRKG